MGYGHLGGSEEEGQQTMWLGNCATFFMYIIHH